MAKSFCRRVALVDILTFTQRLAPCMIRKRSMSRMFKNRLKRLTWALCWVGGAGLMAASSGFAVPGTLHVMLLDREPFYSPRALSLRPGQTVQWQNRSMQAHTITHDRCGRSGGCVFHSGRLHPCEQFTVRDLAPGSYPYHCAIHPFMRGVIVVDRPPTRHSNTAEL